MDSLLTAFLSSGMDTPQSGCCSPAEKIDRDWLGIDYFIPVLKLGEIMQMNLNVNESKIQTSSKKANWKAGDGKFGVNTIIFSNIFYNNKFNKIRLL